MNEIRIMPEHFGGLEFANQTNIHTIAIVILIACLVAIIAVPRRNAIWPFLIITCFISSAQRVAILTIDFNFLRILILAGVARVLFRKEHIDVQKHPLDKLLVAFWLSRIVVSTLQTGTLANFVNELGGMADATGAYLIFRCSLKSWKDIRSVFSAIALIAIPVAAFFVSEYSTGRNLFSIFGGVNEYTMIRDGRLRCQGPYTHPILAGAFWASMLPLVFAQAKVSLQGRAIYWLAVASAVWIVFASSSSTPVFGVVAAIIGGVFFYFKEYMRPVRWGVLILLVSLHMVMQAPVWHLIVRVSAVGGSTAYHRYQLINHFILRLNEWWLLGLESTAHWFWGAQDLTNQYVFEGVRGGLLTLILFIALISIAFRSVGRTWRRVSDHSGKVVFTWAIGVSFFAHCAMFIGVSYFGHIVFLWNLALAMIASTDCITSANSGARDKRERS